MTHFTILDERGEVGYESGCWKYRYVRKTGRVSDWAFAHSRAIALNNARCGALTGMGCPVAGSRAR